MIILDDIVDPVSQIMIDYNLGGMTNSNLEVWLILI